MNYVLYHANCQDGLGAKYAAWKKFGENAKYLPVQYGEDIPFEVYGPRVMFVDVPIDALFYDPASKSLYTKVDAQVATMHKENVDLRFDQDEWVCLSKTNDVYICDFSYPLEALKELRESVNTLVVLDHHKTAQEALSGFPGAIFDMNRSGAMIAWNYFHPTVPAPRLIEYVQDRDLWRKQYRETDAVASAIPFLNGDMEQWDIVAENEDDLQDLSKAGETVESYKRIKVQEALQDVAILPYRGYKAGVRNYTENASDIGAAICNSLGVDFSMTYFIDPTGMVVVSFRSRKDGVDVGALAKEHGGGGHKAASGMRVDFDFLSKLLVGEL